MDVAIPVKYYLRPVMFAMAYYYRCDKRIAIYPGLLLLMQAFFTKVEKLLVKSANLPTRKK